MRRLRGDDLPKQYVNFIGRRSMLEHTCDRAARVVPLEKLFVVVSKEHLSFPEVRRQLAAVPPDNVVVQPANRDTVPGILLPLLHVHKRYPDAIVAIFPSDHFVLEEERFMSHVRRAFSVVESDLSRLVLLGVDPRGPDPDYGYIVPGKKIDDSRSCSVRQIEMFVEKPPSEAAAKVISREALWNTMVTVFACKTFLSVVPRAVPGLHRMIEEVRAAVDTPDEKDVTERVYQRLPALNFSKGILEALPFEHRRSLVVLPARGVTWADWGTPERLLGTLRLIGEQISARRPRDPAPENLPASTASRRPRPGTFKSAPSR